MKTLTVYQYPYCGTCREAVKFLEAKSYKLELHNIFESPPAVDVLEKLVKLSGKEIKAFFNTSGDVYKQMNLKDQLKSMSDSAKLDLLASNGRLIKRPIVTDGEQVTVGFKQDFMEVWG